MLFLLKTLSFKLAIQNNLLVFRYVDIWQSTITSKKNFLYFNIIFSSYFYPTFRMPKLVHVHGNILVWALIDNSQYL